MFDSVLHSLLGSIKVKEENDVITLAGFNGPQLVQEMSRVWNSSKVSKNMFTKVSRIEVSFRRFFLMDVIYTMETLLKAPRVRINRRAVQKALEELKTKTSLSGIYDTEMKHRDILNMSALSDFHFTPKDYQDEYLRRYNEIVPRYRLKGHYLAASPGAGKGLPLDTPVRVPTGWKNIGSLEVGDEVMTSDSSFCKVTGIFDNSNMQCFRIEFEDGREVICDIEHRWNIHHDSLGLNEYETVSMQTLFEYYQDGLEGLSIPLVATDGDTTEINEEVDEGALGRKLVNGIISHLDQKHFLLVSTQRMNIMHAILDNLNAEQIYTEHGVSYRLKSSRINIVNTLKELCYSLGKLVKVTEDNGIYDLDIYDAPYLNIVNVEKIYHSDTRCIKVDHPSELFVIKDYIVTHNTVTSLMLHRCLESETVFVISPKNAVVDVWRKTLNTAFKRPTTHWDSLLGSEPTLGKEFYVFHYNALDLALKFIMENRGKFGRVGIIIDEGHNFNEIKSDRTQRLIELVGLSNSSNTLWMSGTPLKAMGKECVPFLKTIDPLFNNKVEKEFLGVFGNASDRALDILANRLGVVAFKVQTKQFMNTTELFKHRVEVNLPNGKEYTLTEIRKKMEIFVAERAQFYKKHADEFKNDYLEGLGWFSDTIANDDAEQLRFAQYKTDVEDVRKAYDPVRHKDVTPRLNKYEKDVIIPRLPDNLKKRFRKAKSVYKYVELTILGEALGGVFGKIRSQCNADIAANLHDVLVHDQNGMKYRTSLKEIIENGEKKTILFTSFVEVVNGADMSLRQIGFKPLQVYGDTNKDLPKIVMEFDRNPDANPLIATFQSLSTAVPLTMASQIVMLNSPFREHDYTQAVARAHRLGNNVNVHVYDVFLNTNGEPNISTRSKDILDSTAKSVAIMLGIEKVDLTVGVESLEDLDRQFDLNQTHETYSSESLVEVPLVKRNNIFTW